MALAQEDIERIRRMIREEVARATASETATVRYDLELRERLVRLEEELKHQRELMAQGFEQMDRRFQQVDKRLEQVDKRFEQVDKRFEHMEQRFDRFMRWSFGLTLTAGGLVVAAIKYLP